VKAGRVGAVLRRPAAVNGVVLGEPVDVLLDRHVQTALGLRVHCRDGADRFVPWAVGELGPTAITVDRPLAILDGEQLDYYLARSIGLAELLRLPVVSRGVDVARVADLVVDEDGRVRSVVLVDARGERAVDRRGVEVGLDRLRLVENRDGPVVVSMFPSGTGGEPWRERAGEGS
jgi:hypothetical protein